MLPIRVAALVRGGAVLVTAAATAALLTVPAGGTEADAHDGRTDGGRTDGGRTTETRQIASSVLNDVRFTLTAVRSAADPLMASVRLEASVRENGRFVPSDEVRVGAVDGWFWFPLTGRGAICEFSTANTEPAPVAVSLLITPSIGCSAPQRFELRDGTFETDGQGARAPRGGVSAGGGGTAGRAA
ncbi:hypothetical protein BU52_18300 [Streptomyces toyocaensis]|uniref:Uncharacterized protein n=1 Tax=Streptomyces toyocaensis TaxID=55952 RepID=A0A081XQD6_STRTO|nr:hypothetical protein [Streptomyces toyocaensis]KES05759.1 hypothetical protein BU52_18300 [Streptomyces toyocaensis]